MSEAEIHTSLAQGIDTAVARTPTLCTTGGASATVQQASAGKEEIEVSRVNRDGELSEGAKDKE